MGGSSSQLKGWSPDQQQAAHAFDEALVSQMRHQYAEVAGDKLQPLGNGDALMVR